MNQAPKRLAIFVATSGHSGVDRIMKNLIPAFVARGVAVDVLKIKNHGLYLDPLPEGVRLIELGTRHVNTSLPALVRYLRRCRPDVLLSDKDKVNRLAIMGRFLARVPTRVVVRMGTTVSVNLAKRKAHQRWAQYQSLRWFYRFADAIVTPSQGAAEDLAAIAHLPSSAVTVINNPVVTADLIDKGRAAPPHPWLADKSIPVILGVGELSARKDFATLVHAFATVANEMPARLLILGEGKKRQELEFLIAQLQLQDKAQLLGFVDNPFPYIAHADLLALSSVCEGFGNVLVEAMALGTALVSTDCPSGPAEIFDQEKYGRLAPVADHQALADAMLATLRQPPASELLAQGATRFTVNTIAERYLEVLDLS